MSAPLVVLIIAGILFLIGCFYIFLEVLPELKKGAKEATEQLMDNLDDHFDHSVSPSIKMVQKKRDN